MCRPLYFRQWNITALVASVGKCCHPHVLSEGVSACWLMWFPCSGSWSRLVGEKSASAQLHKRAIYWESQSGSPGSGPLPRKHSLEGVSPYPCAPAERSQYYHCTALTLSPPLSFSLPLPAALSPPVISVLHFYHKC